MAANEYYHSNIPSPPSYDQVTGGRAGAAHTTPGYGYGYAAQDSGNDNDPSAPYHHRESQQSLASDTGYPAAGRMTDGDHYAENIPLKAHTQSGNYPDWMHQQTPYPPSPEALEANRRPRRRATNRKKKGFFQNQIPWVTYTLTLIQVIVFIVELVKAGELRTFLVGGGWVR